MNGSMYRGVKILEYAMNIVEKVLEISWLGLW